MQQRHFSSFQISGILEITCIQISIMFTFKIFFLLVSNPLICEWSNEAQEIFLDLLLVSNSEILCLLETFMSVLYIGTCRRMSHIKITKGNQYRWCFNWVNCQLPVYILWSASDFFYWSNFRYHDTIECYTEETDSWELIGEMPTSRSWLSCVAMMIRKDMTTNKEKVTSCIVWRQGAEKSQLGCSIQWIIAFCFVI